MSTSNAAATAVNTAPSQASVDPFDDPVTSNKMAIRALIPLLITFVLGTLCLQGFNLVFQQVGADVGAPNQASLITAFPSIVLGIVCFIYGSLGDFVSLRKLVTVGLVTLFVGSIFGFVANYFFAANLWTVIIARVLQTAGEQVAGSAFLVVATKYLRNDLKVIFFGLFTAAYQLSASIGVFAAGMLSSIAWQFLFLIPSVTILFLPILLKTLPSKSGNGQKVDAFGFVIFGFATAFLTLFFSYMAWWMLVVSLLLFVAFAFYINKASNPFITPAFFTDFSFISAIVIIFPAFFSKKNFTFTTSRSLQLRHPASTSCCSKRANSSRFFFILEVNQTCKAVHNTTSNMISTLILIYKHNAIFRIINNDAKARIVNMALR